MTLYQFTANYTCIGTDRQLFVLPRQCNAKGFAKYNYYHFLNSVTLPFSERSQIIMKTTIGSSILMKLAYQTQTKPNNTRTNRIWCGVSSTDL